MSEIEKQIMNRMSNEADLAGAQDLIDAHIDEVTGGGFSLHILVGKTLPPVSQPAPIKMA